MSSWKEAIQYGIASGAAASVLSTVALAICGRRETGSPFAATNAVSHWLWGNEAARHDEPNWKYTFPGYLIHHGSATFWAVLLERLCGKNLTRRDPVKTVEAAAITTAVACFVDYRMTPQRLQPGYEMRLSKPSLFAVYAAFGIGLAIGAHAVRSK